MNEAHPPSGFFVVGPSFLLLLVGIAVGVIVLRRTRRLSTRALSLGIVLLAGLFFTALLVDFSASEPAAFKSGVRVLLFLAISLAALLLAWQGGRGRQGTGLPQESRFPLGRRIAGTILFVAAAPLAAVFVLTLLRSIFGAPGDSSFLLLLPLIALCFWGGVRLLRPELAAVQQGGCPPVGRLKELLAERLPPSEHARLSAHLERCPACQHRLEGLTAGHQSWPDVARKLSDRPPAPEPALQKVIDRLKQHDDHEATGEAVAFSAELPLGFLSPPDKPGQLGRLERYEVLSEIGRGGMGVVLKAFDPTLHRVVAIKVLAPQLATSGVARKRFLREAKAAAAVTHDHIVTIHAVDEANGLPYLVMQYVAGPSLQERIDKDGPLELAETLRIGMQTASGLAAAHAHGIIHRDIKPGNILLEDGVQRVKITDFGLARTLDDASLTQSGCVAGSPLYMAPEQARGEALDPRSDLFSLGSVLYTMCTGRPPFRAANTLAVLRRVSEESPRPIRETNPEIPDWLAAAVEKLQAKDPAERYQSAAEVVEVLGQHLAQLQHAAWVPPPAPAPAAANAAAPGLPTSLTLCPSCGASLHVPERMVGGTVHCPECGKPFRVENASEEIRLARAVPRPFGPRPRVRQRPSAAIWVLVGLIPVGLFLLVVAFYLLRQSPEHAAMSAAAVPPPERVPPTTTVPDHMPLADPFWKGALSWFPPDALWFGALDLKPFGSLTLDDDRTQTALRLAAGVKAAAPLTAENLGRIQIDGLAVAYYEDATASESGGVLHLQGLVQDGRKRIFDYVRQATSGDVQIEGQDPLRTLSEPVTISSPHLPLALGYSDDNHLFLARSALANAKQTQHRKLLKRLRDFSFPEGPRVPGNLLSGYLPPWARTALAEVPPEDCGFCLGEIPAEWRQYLTGALELRACPRTFIGTVRREGDGVALGLNLNVDKAGAELLLREDLDRWRRQALDVMQARFPALKKEPEALALVGQTLRTMTCGANPGGGTVQVYVQVSGPAGKAVWTLLKRVAQQAE